MIVMRLTPTDAEFYSWLGPIFGSRAIEKKTRDRFYDHPDKRWYLVPDRGAASVLGGVVKNFWAEDEQTARALLTAMLQDQPHLRGIVPRIQAEAFDALGFRIARYKTNFIEVSYERNILPGDECQNGTH